MIAGLLMQTRFLFVTINNELIALWTISKVTAMNLIFQTSLILLSVTFLGIILRYLKQPLILAYVLAGLILGPSLLNISVEKSILETSLTVCLSVVLFVYGLKLNTKVISFLGSNLLLSFFIQFIIFFSLMLVFFLSVKLNPFEAVVLSLALSFSSSIIGTKLLDDKKDINNLYGKIAISFSIFQVFFFIVAYVFLQNFSPVLSNEIYLRKSGEMLLKIVIVLANLYLISKFILSRFEKFIANSNDFLILFSISWALVVIGSLKFLGLPYEIGALVSAVFLSTLNFSDALFEKLKSIRDVFLLGLFTVLGLSLNLNVFNDKVFLILLLVVFIFVIRTLILSLVLRIQAYSRRISFLSVLSYNHIGELSLILLSINFVNFDSDFKHVFYFLFILTAVISSYSLHYSEKLFRYFEPIIGFYLKDSIKEEKSSDIVLFGCGIDGYDFIEEFRKKHFDFIGIDFNPEVVQKLKSKKINIIFGDAEDVDLFNKVQVSKSNLVISTIGDFDTNKFILNTLNHRNYKGVKIIYSYSIEESIQLYRLGATFVILPDFLSSQKAADMVSSFGLSHQNYDSEKVKHLELFNKKLLMKYDYKRKVA